MLRTIVTASHISVQGEFIRRLADGREVVRVGDVEYAGKPVSQWTAEIVQLQTSEKAAVA